MLFYKLFAATVVASMAMGNPLPNPKGSKAGNDGGGSKNGHTQAPADDHGGHSATKTHSESAAESSSDSVDLPGIPDIPIPSKEPSETAPLTGQPSSTHNTTLDSASTPNVRMVNTSVYFHGKKNVTLGGFWPAKTPGPADLWVQALDELCDGDACDTSTTSTPVRIKARVPAPPPLSGSFILRDLDLSVKLEQMLPLANAGWREYLQGVLAAYARDASYWSWDEYYEYDTEGQVKVGPVTHESYVSAYDWFVTAPVGWQLKTFSYTKGIDGSWNLQTAGLLQAHLIAEFPDNGSDLVCKIIEALTGSVAGLIPIWGDIITHVVGIGCSA